MDLAPDFDEFCALLTARLDRYAAPCVNVVLIANRTAVPGARSAPRNTGNQPRVFWEIDAKPLTGCFVVVGAHALAFQCGGSTDIVVPGRLE